MGKSNKGKQTRVKTPKNNGRKFHVGRGSDINDNVEFGKEQYEAEKEKHTLSIVERLPTSEVHRAVSSGDFHRLKIYLDDDNLDAEDKKHAAVTWRHEEFGTTPAQEAIRRNAPYDVVEKLLFIGGREAVTAKDANGYNAVHLACKLGSSSDVVGALCFVGKEAVNQQDAEFGDLPIHKVAASGRKASTAVVKTLIDHGGPEMLGIKNKEGHLPVHRSVYFFSTNLEVCKLLVTEGLHHGVGGEEGLGGLNVEFEDGLRSTSKTTAQKLQEKCLLEHVITDTKDVVSKRYGTTIVQAGAKHGLKWEEGLKVLVETTDSEAIKLGIVVLAASGKKTDLHTMYQLCLRYVGILFG